VNIELWWENLREREILKDIGTEGRIILKLIIFRDKMGGGGGHGLSQDRGRWRPLVNVVTNLWVP
jgi:hypothetical protein